MNLSKDCVMNLYGGAYTLAAFSVILVSSRELRKCRQEDVESFGELSGMRGHRAWLPLFHWSLYCVLFILFRRVVMKNQILHSLAVNVTPASACLTWRLWLEPSGMLYPISSFWKHEQKKKKIKGLKHLCNLFYAMEQPHKLILKMKPSVPCLPLKMLERSDHTGFW